MKILFTFPGQGTQYAGMLKEIPNRQAIFSQVAAVLGDETTLLDSPEALKHTRAVQLCLLISGVSWATELIRHDIKPDFVCGMSIGAFPAAVIAGILSFEDAIRIVALRGDLMEQAYPSGYGMTVIAGLRLEQVENIVKDSGTFIANINSEQQIVISGRDTDMVAVAQKALAQGAQKVNRINISVPSHCVLLEKQAEVLLKSFQGIVLNSPRYAYLSGSTGRVLWKTEKIAEDLAFNMSRHVLWNEAMTAANERDVRLSIEMPPGNSLSSLTRQAFREGVAISCQQNSLQLIAHLAKQTQAMDG